MTGRPGDDAALRLDRLELLQARPVDLLRVEVEGRPAADRGPVERLAVRRRPDAGLLAGRREVVAAERVEEALVRGIDDVADHVADAFAVGLRGDLDHRRHDRRLDRDLEHPLDLGDGPFGHDPRRRQPGGHAVAQELGVGRHERRVGVQAGDERVEPLGRVGRLELGELRQQLLRAAHLVDDLQLVQVLVVLLDLELRDDLEHVPRDPVLGRQARGVDRARVGGRPFHERRASWLGPRGPGPPAGRRSARRRRTWRWSGTAPGSTPRSGPRGRRRASARCRAGSRSRLLGSRGTSSRWVCR